MAIALPRHNFGTFFAYTLGILPSAVGYGKPSLSRKLFIYITLQVATALLVAVPTQTLWITGQTVLEAFTIVYRDANFQKLKSVRLAM